MASSTQWTWVWANSGRQWGTGKPGILQLQKVRQDWVTELKWTEWHPQWVIINVTLEHSKWLTVCSVGQSCPTFVIPWTAACQASLSITSSWSLLKLMSIESVMPSNHLILSSPFTLFSLSQHQSLVKWVSSSHQVAKVLEFQLQQQSFQWIFGLISLRLTDLISLQSKGLSRVFSNTTVQKYEFFGIK